MGKHVITHIAGGGDRGGAKTHILTLLKYIDQTRFAVNLICLNDGALAEEARTAGIQVRVFSMASNVDMMVIHRLARFLRHQAPDLVHTHGVRANLCGRSAARLAGQKHILTTIHSLVSLDYQTRLGNSFFSLVDRLSTPMAEHLVCVSHQLKASMVNQGVPAEKISVIHNGIDVTPYAELSRNDGLAARQEWYLTPEQKVVGTVGRLVPIKGYDIFLQAAAKVAAYAPDTMFLMVGDGPCEGALQLQVRELGLEDRVIFAGHRNDIPRLFRAMDMFVISSFSEGGPIVLLEAMASEIPVVATRVGGVPEVLKDNVNGLMAEPGNPLDLADKMIRLLKNPELGTRFCQAGLDTLHSEFTRERVTKKTEQLYERILKEDS